MRAREFERQQQEAMMGCWWKRNRNNFFFHRAGFSAQSFFATFFNMFACGEIIKNKFTERSLH